ncbi:MAG: AEC family transporter [Victivallaceae bacterium]|nr:AEC family transporter [Victivallaceae bacterium]
MDKFLELLPYSGKAVISVFLVALAGVFIVRSKIASQEALRLLGRLAVYLFLPCLLFHKIAAAISPEQLREYWIFPVTCILYISLGLLLGRLTVMLCKPRPEMKSGVIAAIAFNNSGYIPISLVVAITAVFPAFVNDPQAADQAIAFVSIYLLGYSPLLWTVGYSLISGRKLSDFSLNKLFTPPVIGMLTGAAVGLILPLKAMLCYPAGLLNPVYNAVGVIGEATVPCVLVFLGGCLASGPVRGVINKRTIFSVILIKLIIFPAIALGYVWLLRYSGVLPASLLASLVLVIEAGVPTANNLVVMATVTNPGIENGMATLIFWTYLASIITLTFTVLAAAWVFGA